MRGGALNDYPKRIKRILRQLCTQAYEAELARALNDLDTRFIEWKRGAITPFDLNDAIHEFHQNASRELYNKYSNPLLGPTIASAIADGLLDREVIAPEVLSYITDDLTFFDAAM